MEKTALLKKHFELVYAVAAELLVLEVDRVPGSFLTIQDIDCPGIRIPGHDQGQQGRRRQFDPANDLDVFGSLISPATAVCSSTPGSTCSAGSTIIRPNIAVFLSGLFAHVVLLFRARTPPMAHSSTSVGEGQVRGGSCFVGSSNAERG